MRNRAMAQWRGKPSVPASKRESKELHLALPSYVLGAVLASQKGPMFEHR